MSVTIKLYKNYSDNNVVSKYIEQIGEDITGTFREETSVLKPSVKIAGTVPVECNYFYISEFGRYYYIDDIVSVRNNLYEISGHVDVLHTYQDSIKACSGIIYRQESEWNLYLDDGSFKAYNNPKFKVEPFGTGFDSLHFILAVAGNSQVTRTEESEK